MTLDEYLEHYLVLSKMLHFFLLALAGAFACILIIILFKKLSSSFVSENKRNKIYNNSMLNAVQRFYEIIISSACILSFLSMYYLLDRFMLDADFRNFWDAHKDFLLLAMIVISIILNNIIDHILIPLKKINNDDRCSLRVVGMLYVIMIFMYIKYIYENPNYDGFIMYFLGLMIGRFIYFDASFKDFFTTMANAVKQLPIMILGLAYTGFMCYFGFSEKYLLKSNGVLVSTFIAHLYMIIAIFIIHHSHVVLLFRAKITEKSE